MTRLLKMNLSLSLKLKKIITLNKNTVLSYLLKSYLKNNLRFNRCDRTQRWVRRFARLISNKFRTRKKSVNGSWQMDETHIKLNGKWIYLYRAVDKEGYTVGLFSGDPLTRTNLGVLSHLSKKA